jgi:hypothetical protein
MHRRTSAVLVALVAVPLLSVGLSARAEPDPSAANGPSAPPHCTLPLAPGVEVGAFGPHKGGLSKGEHRGFGQHGGKRGAFGKHGGKGGGLAFVYDDNEDGTLNAAELQNRDADLQRGCTAKNARLLQEADRDRDGLLQQAEWDAARRTMKQRHKELHKQHGGHSDVKVDATGGAKDDTRSVGKAHRAARKAERKAAHAAAATELRSAFDDDGDGTLNAGERASLRSSMRAVVQAGERLPVPPHALKGLLAAASTTTAPVTTPPR